MRRIVPALLLLLLAPAARALGPENLLLITNKNVPEGRALAEFYAAQRKVPDGRILELDLPTGDEVSFTDYETRAFPVVREFLLKHELASRVSSVVTFYGVPLRIAARVNGPGDAIEVAAIRQELAAAIDQGHQALAGLEAIAHEVDPTFNPTGDKGLPGLVARSFAARQVLGRHGRAIDDAQAFDAFMQRIERAAAPLDGPAQIKQRRVREIAVLGDHMTPEQRKEATALSTELFAFRAKFDDLEIHRADPNARSQLRQLVKAQLGLIEYARLLEGTADYFQTDNTDASFDSELALLWWNAYSRSNGLGNPLQYRVRRNDFPMTLMTMRLDAPTPELLKSLIAAGIKAEADGLTGKIVVDAGGNQTINAPNMQSRATYAAFDQTLQHLAEIVRTQTKLPLVYDTRPEVLPANSADDVALYCGWYALQNYTPACKFVPGAVGYHVASFELTTALRNGNQRGWCRGLMNDGVAATLGAVQEPFLHAFPPPDEFFPLLMTGKLTLAEVYWKTNPLVSWRIAMIGDPLYSPFKAKPALEVENLPGPLQEGVKAYLAGHSATGTTRPNR